MTPRERKNVATTGLMLAPIAVIGQYFFSQSLHDGFAGGPTPESAVALPCLFWLLCCLATLAFTFKSLSWGRKWVWYFVILLAICGVGLYLALDEYVSWGAAI